VAKRNGMSRKRSKKLFRNTAGNERVHPKNGLFEGVHRGGIRL
jgi:hypothetical protein